MPTEQCVFLILYIRSIYGILYMYITKYSCVFLKLGESIYMAMDLIPILLGSLPLAHNAQHSLVIEKGRITYWGKRERGPSCGLNGRAVTIYIIIDRRPYVHRYCACAALRANVAGRIGNRFSPAESAFLVPSATSAP